MKHNAKYNNAYLEIELDELSSQEVYFSPLMSCTTFF